MSTGTGSPGQKKVVSLYDLFAIAADSSLDPACIVSARGEIVHANYAFMQLSGLRKRDLARKPLFCDIVKLEACAKQCQITKALASGKVFRIDDAPGALASPGKAPGTDDGKRITVKCTPLYHPEPEKAAKPVAGVIQLRDTTAEVALHEKFRTVARELETKSTKIQSLENKTRQLQLSARTQPIKKPG